MSTHVNVNTLDFSFRNYFVKITLLSKLCNVIHPFISGLCGGLESILAVIKGTSGTSWTGCHGARRVTEQTAISFTVLEVTQAQEEDANTERAHLAGGFKLCTLFLCLKRSSRSLLL